MLIGHSPDGAVEGLLQKASKPGENALAGARPAVLSSLEWYDFPTQNTKIGKRDKASLHTSPCFVAAATVPPSAAPVAVAAPADIGPLVVLMFILCGA